MVVRRAHPRWPMTRVAMIAVAVCGLALDRATKSWALRALSAHDHQIIPGWLSLHLVFNSGAAFSMGTSLTVVLSCISTVALVFVLVWVFPRARGRLVCCASGLIAAGIAGNLLDRLCREPGPGRGTVVDFIAVRYFAVFNIADVCITCAAVLFVYWAVRSDRAERSDRALSGPGARPGSRTDPGHDPSTDPGLGSGSGAGPGSSVDADTDPGSRTDADLGKGADLGSSTDLEDSADAGNSADADPGARTDLGSGSAAGPGGSTEPAA